MQVFVVTVIQRWRATFFFSSRRRHTRCGRDWSSDVCSSDLDGHGRVACCEIMVMTGRVHDMILDPKLTGQLPEVVAEGAYYGMQTFDQHLLKHLRAGRITFEEAMRAATSPHDFKLMVAAEGPVPAGGAPEPSEPEFV